MTMNKNAVIELFLTLHSEYSVKRETFLKLAASEQSDDEKKVLNANAKTMLTHMEYIERITKNVVLLDAVALQIVQSKISEAQIREINNDAYSVSKLGELLISIVQKRKVQEHALAEALAVIAQGVTGIDSTAFGKKMTNTKNAPYTARQAQMVLCLLERLNVCTIKKDGNRKLYEIDHNNALCKRIMKLYE